ncbi:MAG: nitric oxide synthase NOS, partial [Pleurocapsa sp.]
MDTQLIVEKKVVVFSQPNYEPAQQLVNLLQNAAGMFRAIQVSDLEQDLTDIADSYSMVVFITPADFSNAIYLAGAVTKIAQELKIEKLAWIAPSAAKNSGLEQGLSRASEIIDNSDLDVLILRHAPVFSDLLNFKKEIKFRRTLSLPLVDNVLPWIAPEDIAEGVYRWIAGTNDEKPPKVLTGTRQLGGIDLAQEISTVLERNLDGVGFARRCFNAIDKNRSGDL